MNRQDGVETFKQGVVGMKMIEGLLALADWFDVRDSDSTNARNTQVQDDLRRWSKQHERLRNKNIDLKNENLKLTAYIAELKAALKLYSEAAIRQSEWFEKGLKHSVFCNFPNPELKYCNCGLTNLQEAHRRAKELLDKYLKAERELMYE